MDEKAILGMSTSSPASDLVRLEATPEPLDIDLKRTAVIVVDMLNAFASKGGMIDLRGFDILPCQKIIKPIKRINSAARARGVKVIHIVHRYSPDLREAGGPNSPNWYRELTPVCYREHPEWRDKLEIRGTWGADIVKELEPEEGDIIVEKQRYSAFVDTNLDMILKTHSTKYLAFVGVATNICVEASLRDAFYLGYFSILISDAAAPVGPPFMQDAAIYNVKQSYGWVTTSENVIRAME